MSTLLLQAKYIVTNPLLREEGLITDGAICVQDATITEVGHFETLRTKYPEAQLLGSNGHMAIPGFIDTHNHGQGLTTFSQGIQDDQLEPWVHYWPGRLPRPAEHVHLDTLVAIARQIRSGVTTSMRHDTPSLPPEAYISEAEAIIKAYERAGLRFAYALGTTDQFRLVYDDNDKFIQGLPTEVQSTARQLSKPGEKISVDECLTYLETLHGRYKDTSRINIMMGVIGPQWDSDEILTRFRDKSQELGTGMHGPLLETLYQKLYAHREFGHSAGKHFYRFGMLGPGYSCAHGVWLTEEDMEIFADTGATVIHCPSSNLRLHSGIAPVPLMLTKGVNVALGVDTCSINDNDDTFQEMRLAMMLSRQPVATSKTLKPLDEWDVLAMATINGARAVLLADRIGSLEPGKEADITLVKLDRIMERYLHPSIGPVAALIYRGHPQDIDIVMVAGEVVFREGRVTGFNEAETQANLKTHIPKDQPAERERDAMVAQVMPHIKKYYVDWPIPELDPIFFSNSRR